MKPDARLAAINIIQAIDSGSHAQAALDAGMDDLPVRDRRLCSDLVYGVLRLRIRIGYLLAKVLKKPERTPPRVLIAMEIGVYSLLMQEKIPAHAAVNETVKIVKNEFGQKLANFANACLRSLLREGEALNSSSFYGKDKSVFYSLPAPIYRLWINGYGRLDAARLLRKSWRRPAAGLRVNLAHPSAKGLMAELEKDFERAGKAGFIIPPGEKPEKLLEKDLASWHREGAISWQAPGSQEALASLGIYEAWRDAPIWDACAGVGGKTATMLENGLNVGFATDCSSERLNVLPKECQRLGLRIPLVLASDAANAPLGSWQGHILLDTPCSGLGVLRRRPDIKARWRQAETEKLIALQRRLLVNLYRLLAPGYELCYLTCSLNPAENEEQIAWLREREPEAELVCKWQTPFDHPWYEGMYGARLRKPAI